MSQSEIYKDAAIKCCHSSYLILETLGKEMQHKRKTEIICILSLLLTQAAGLLRQLSHLLGKQTKCSSSLSFVMPSD